MRVRFVKGVVDSEDLPLSISREKPQDSLLLKRIKEVLTRKLIRFFEEKHSNEPDSYRDFFVEYNIFLKEGICQDFKYQEQLAKILLFESSTLDEGKLTTFDEYIAMCSPEQKEIFYLVAPNRQAALESPYFETFKKHNKEVLLLYTSIDDFVMGNLRTYQGRGLTSAETSSIKFDEPEGDKKEDAEKSTENVKLTNEEATELCGWLKTTLDKKVRDVRLTDRLSDSPAIVTDHESGALRRMMKVVVSVHCGYLHYPTTQYASILLFIVTNLSSPSFMNVTYPVVLRIKRIRADIPLYHHRCLKSTLGTRF